MWAFVIGGSECRKITPPFLPFLFMTQRVYRCLYIYHFPLLIFSISSFSFDNLSRCSKTRE